MEESRMYNGNNSLLVKLVNKHGTRNTNKAYMEAVDRAIRNIDLAKINKEVAKEEPIAEQHEGGIAAITAYPVNDKIEL